MTNKKPKKSEKRQIPLRTRGDVLVPSERPSKTLFDAVIKAERDLEITHPNSPQDNPSQPIPTHLNLNKNVEISPVKNFTKVPNSTVKNAIPEKLFKGLSKHTYDILYYRTRGAINPVREIQLTKFELQKLTGLSENTVSSHIKNLRESGLISTRISIGKHEGSVYEVFVYEELDASPQPIPTHPNPSQDNPFQKLVPIPSQELGGVGGSNLIENITTYETAKTFLKTNTDDDEGFAKFINIFNEAVIELTGRKISIADQDKMQSLAELLVLELRSAARRTGTISNAPAFLTEVLRRKLLNQPTEKLKTSPDTVGKSSSDKNGSYEIKPLTEQGREVALGELREFANENFLEDFKKWYTPEDWQWLTNQLKSASKTPDHERVIEI